MRLPVVAIVGLLLGTGCAHRGLRFPGPTRGMGEDPQAYADTLDGEEGEEQEVARIERKERPIRGEERRPRRGGAGEEVARAAGNLVGKDRLMAKGEEYRNDCSGLVLCALARADIDARGSTRDLYELADANGLLHRRKMPQPGDVAFFDDTYDRNNNRRRDDDLSHIAVVESVERDGTIVLVHKGSDGVSRIEMNLKRPHDRRAEDGKELNDPLRAMGDRDGGPILTGELWRAFGSLWALGEDEPAVAEAP